MRARCLGALAAGLAVVTLGALPQAHADSRFEVHDRSLRLAVFLEASNGYLGLVTTQGHKRVRLNLWKGDTEIEALTSGRVTRHGIDARFADLGEISVRFRGRPIDLRSRGDGDGNGERRCRGRKPTLEAGLFTGKVRFRGENGFTRVDAERATGFVDRRYRRVCRRDPKVGSSIGAVLERLFGSLPVTALRASARVDRANVVFEALAIDFSPFFGPGAGLEYLFSAQLVERDQGTRLARSVGAEGSDRSFLFRRTKVAPRTATVKAPKPFAGNARYGKERGAPASWAGSLTAHLPGAGSVAVAGPEFEAVTCNLTLAALLKGRCLPGSGSARFQSLARLSRGLRQGSGSQSQVFWDDRLPWSR